MRSMKQCNCRQTATQRPFHSLFSFLHNIPFRRAVQMPESAIQDLSRYIWHFSAAQPHLSLCPSASPVTQTLLPCRSVQKQTLSQLPFSSSFPLERAMLFSTTAQWPSFHSQTPKWEMCACLFIKPTLAFHCISSFKKIKKIKKINLSTNLPIKTY